MEFKHVENQQWDKNNKTRRKAGIIQHVIYSISIIVFLYFILLGDGLMFKRLFKDEEVIEFRLITNDKQITSRWVKVNGTLETDIQNIINKYNTNCNIYFGANPRKGNSTTEVSRVSSCFIDIDSKDFISIEAFNSHIQYLEKKLFPHFQLLPSIKVSSGHGYHFYWVLSENIEGGRWREIQIALIEIFNSDPTLKDLPRIIRVPGSMNIKKETPVKCEVVYENDNTYTERNFLPVLEQYKKVETTKKASEREYSNQSRNIDKETFVNAVITTLEEYGQNMFSDYQDFRKLIFSCKAGGVPYERIDPILQQSAGYDLETNEKLYASAKVDKITFGSAYYYAKQANEDRLRELLRGVKLELNKSGENYISLPTDADDPFSNINTMPAKVTDPLPPPEEELPLPMTVRDVKNSIGNIESNPVIDNLLYRESISFLFGDPGSCKTWLTLDLCFNLADGNTVWGQFETSPKKVLFFEGDFTLPILKYRFDRFKENANQDNFLSLNTEQFHQKKIEYLLETAKGKDTFERYLQKFNPDLVVIDSLGEFTGIDESKQKEMKNVIDFLKIMAKKYSNHILVLHHSRKRSNNERQERQMDMSDMTGSYVISRYASTIFCINPIFDEEGKVPNRGLVVNVKNWFRNINRFEFALTETEEEAVSITYNSEVVTSHKSKTQQCKTAILNLLQSDPTGFSQKEIVSITGFNLRLTGEVLRELVKENKIQGIGSTTRRIYKIELLHELLHDTREVCKSGEKSYTGQGKDSYIGNVRVMEEFINNVNNNNNDNLLHDSYIGTCNSSSLTGQGKANDSYIDIIPCNSLCKSSCNNPEEKILCKNCNSFPS
jgi:hypothetical protein